MAFDCKNKAMRFVQKDNDSSDGGRHSETHSFDEGEILHKDYISVAGSMSVQLLEIGPEVEMVTQQ